MPRHKNPDTELIHSPGGWVVDKRISLPTLVTLIFYALFSAWYVAKIDSRVTAAQEAAVAADAKAQKAVDAQTSFGERLVRIETLVEGTNQAIARVEKKLEK
jgi:hypothetical protein